MGDQSGFTRQKSERFSGGFTITEVMLFLAISGLLLVGALAGVSANINNTRFNDAVRSTTSFLQGQYDEVSTGRNDRNPNLSCDSALNINTTTPRPVGMTNCVVLGRFLKFEDSTVTSRYIVAYSTVSFTKLPQDDAAALADPRVSIAVANDQTFAGSFGIPWEIEFTGAKIPAQPIPVTVLGLAIVRSPVSGNIMYYAFPAIAGQPTQDIEANLTSIYLNKKATLCLSDGNSREGTIAFSPGKGQDVISTDLSITAESCS